MDIQRFCFVCGKPLSVGVTRTVKQVGIQTIIGYSKKYGDDKWKMLEQKSEILVHKRCNLSYTFGQYNLPEYPNSPGSTRFLRSSSAVDFDFKSRCLFCQKSLLKDRMEKYMISSDKMQQKISDIAEARGDELGRVVSSIVNSVPSLVDVYARYHKKCFLQFKYIAKNKNATDYIRPRIYKSLRLIYNHIENNERRQFTINELKQVVNNELDVKTIIKYLKIKYDEDITIVTYSGQGTIIRYSGKGRLPVDEYMGPEEKNEDERIKIIRTAAELIRKQIQSTNCNTKTCPSSENSLDDVDDDIPKYLNVFMSELMLHTMPKKKSEQDLGENEAIEIEDDAKDNSGQEAPQLENPIGDTHTEEFKSYDDKLKKMDAKKNCIAHSIISALQEVHSDDDRDRDDNDGTDDENTETLLHEQPSTSSQRPMRKRRK